MPINGEEVVWAYRCLSKGRRGFGCPDAYQWGGGSLGLLIPIKGEEGVWATT